jgi:hypothetical protein
MPDQELKLRISIKEVRFNSFTTTEHEAQLESKPEPNEFAFKFELRMNLTPEEKTAQFILTTRIFLRVNPTLELGSISGSFTLGVENFPEIVRMEHGILKVPDALMMTGVAAAVSTLRGMFVMCAATSKISNAIIPLTNSKAFLEAIKKGVNSQIHPISSSDALK